METHASARRAWIAMIALVPAAFIVGLDITILSVALPTLAHDLSASTDQLQWFVMAYTMTFAAAILPSGLLADRYGRRKILLISLAIFGLGSLACALSSNSTELIVARALLGVGAAGIATLSTALVAVLFPEDKRGKAMLAIMLVNMLGMPIGPILGGWMLGQVGWQWIFTINLPIVILALIIARVAIPETKALTAPKLDLFGLGTVSAALVLLCYGVTEAGSGSWSDLDAWLPTLLGVALGGVFLFIQSRARSPLVPLRLFRKPRFSAGAAAASVISFIVAGILFIVPQYSQAVLGASTEQSGFYLISFSAGMLVAAPLMGRLTARFGRALIISFGSILAAVALGLASTSTSDTPGWWLVLWAALVGVALGLVLPTSMAMALSDLDNDAEGVGSAVVQALRQVATTLGAAVLGGVLATGYRNNLTLQAPAQLLDIANKGVEQGLAVAAQLGSPQAVRQVQDAFMAGMASVNFISALLSLLSGLALLIGTLVYRQRQRAAAL